MYSNRNISSYDLGEGAALSSKDGLTTGQLVRSVAGRDKGRYYLVVAIDEKGFAWLADGRSRPAAKPKRKNPCHLQRVNKVAADLTPPREGNHYRDEEIRAAITELLKFKEG